MKVSALGKFRTSDVGASKTLVASFNGEHFISERDGDKLNIFAIGDTDGAPGVLTKGAPIADSKLRSIADLNKINRERRAAKLGAVR